MYSGFAISNQSGNWLGVHQKFDRIAYRCLKPVLGDAEAPFPSLGQILHFEGRNGPDGLKIKSPGYDEPHHFYNPHQPDQTGLLDDLRYHAEHLRLALDAGETDHAAWQAAWLAHAIVDGLTPAHHYPYEDFSYSLRGETIGRQTKVLDKVLIKRSSRQNVSSRLSLMALLDKNWSLWGSKGLILKHALFELGVAFIVKPASFKYAGPTDDEIRCYEQKGLIKSFKEAALQIAEYEMYEDFNRWGWTPKLALRVRNEMAPSMIRLIVLAWREAALAPDRPRASTKKAGLPAGS